MKSIRRGIYNQLKVRAPRLLARASGEFPLASARDIYTDHAPTGQAIPNIVYQTWSSLDFGRTHLRHLRAFREANPDYSFRFFADADLDAYMDDAYRGTEIRDIFHRGRFGPLKTDIWRYCILYERGGVYCDIGKGFSAPLHDLVPPSSSAVISFERNRYDSDIAVPPSALLHPDHLVINWALMFAPGHPLLARVIQGIVDKYPLYRGRPAVVAKADILRFTGPIHLTECVHAFAVEAGMEGIKQAGIDFNGAGVSETPGAYVRYLEKKSYMTAQNTAIVD